MKNRFIKSATKPISQKVAAELLSALSWITRCAHADGPAGTTVYFISDEFMNAAKKAVAKATR